MLRTRFRAAGHQPQNGGTLGQHTLVIADHNAAFNLTLSPARATPKPAWPSQGRIEASSSTAQTRLQLGYLLRQTDNQRLNPRGHGADLATAAWGAVRAGSGC